MHLPLVLGAQDTEELFNDIIRIVLGQTKKNKTLRDENDEEIRYSIACNALSWVRVYALKSQLMSLGI